MSLFTRALSALAFILLGAVLYGQAAPAGTQKVGAMPLGVVVGPGFIAVANSGDNTISMLGTTSTFAATVPNIPSPYALSLSDCGPIVVTSPSANSVSLVYFDYATLKPGAVKTIGVGSQPKSLACYDGVAGENLALISNTADATISVINLNSLTVVATIAGVPGASGFHGISVFQNAQGNLIAWVAGTSANVITIVDLSRYVVLQQVPVNAPNSIQALQTAGQTSLVVSSERDGTLIQFDPSTATVKGIYASGLTRPQDFAFASFATMVVQGGTDTIAAVTSGKTSVFSVPGAASVVATQISQPDGTVSPTIAFPGGAKAAAIERYSPEVATQPYGEAWVTSTPSNSVYVFLQTSPVPAAFTAPVNGASFANIGIAPGSLASVFTSTGATQQFSATSLPLPTSLGQVSLSLNGTLQLVNDNWTYSSVGASLAPLLYVGPNQINFQVPPGIPPGSSVPAQVTTASGAMLITTIQVPATTPGIFTLLQNGQGQGAVLNQDSSHNGSPTAVAGATPAARGSVIQIFATGAGATNPVLAAGQPAPSNGTLVLTVAQPTVTIGGVNATVQFSGLAPGYVGLWQINAVVPESVTPGNAVSLVVSAGGVSSNSVTIAVQ